MNAPASCPRAEAPVGLFAEKEEPVVEQADIFQTGPAHHHEAARNCLNGPRIFPVPIKHSVPTKKRDTLDAVEPQSLNGQI